MIKIPELIQRAKDLGMPAVAITDHGTLFGILDFYLQAQKNDVKPIIGCEVYVAPSSINDKGNSEVKSGYHLVLLAQNNNGLKNLIYLCSTAYMYGFYHKPRVDKDLLTKYNDGLIALSGCLNGEIIRKILSNDMDSAVNAVREYAAIFPDRFYLEIQANNIPEQNQANQSLIKLSQQTGIPLVATNDCHYLNADDRISHDILLCIQTNAKVDQEKRLSSKGELYFKTEEEMRSLISIEEAFSNTVKIADECNVSFDLDNYKHPTFDTGNTKALQDEFRDLAYKGFKQKFGDLDDQKYLDRLEYEIETITAMGFPGYFLIVQDFINWAKKNGIPVGPGRGSAAGSLVAYCLGITDINPLPYNLLFERFLNKDRVSMPDIDVDFCERRRDEVLQYVSQKYGEDNVAQISTFGTMKAKAVVKDVGRALGVPYHETDKISKIIPNGMSLEEALENGNDFKELYDSDPKIKNLIDNASRLEGLTRHASTHAAGVVIADKPLPEYSPLYRGKTGEVVTQFDMSMIEKIGLIKFDFLGLRTMTVIKDCLDWIYRTTKEKLDLNQIPLDDPETYETFGSGCTDGMFQVESAGMQGYLTEMQPTEFEDLIAMLALYRPGPLGSGMVESYMRRRAGKEIVEYPTPELEEILKPTYGIIVYQEQVMQIAQKMAGYTLSEADILRKAMGKKKPEQMAQQKDKFINGSVNNGYTKEKADEIFQLIEKFAAYGFNKSHSASYALISYWTGYLKTHYPTCFMAALLSSEAGNEVKIRRYTEACRLLGIELKIPDINDSMKEFTVKNDYVIRFGLGAIKGLGIEAINNIFDVKKKKWVF